MNDAGRSRSSLFLMEMIVTILFFSLAAAVCVKCFVSAHMMGKETYELNHAIAIATGYAEVMRGTDGDIDSIQAVYPDSVKGDDSYLMLFYDSEFNPCDPDLAVYAGDVTLTPNGAIQNMHVKIVRVEDSTIIYELDATKYLHSIRG
ncbi:MAG: hypothetical protein K6A71_04085 [Lachnospiraceae bacterium]|nr:hypothetical protein [Lachnospiraceae bacterium]